MFLALHAVVFQVPIDAGKLERISNPSLRMQIGLLA